MQIFPHKNKFGYIEFFAYLCNEETKTFYTMRFNWYFLNPFGKQEAKIWLFNVHFYNCESYWALTINILNFSFRIEYLKKNETQIENLFAKLSNKEQVEVMVNLYYRYLTDYQKDEFLKETENS